MPKKRKRSYPALMKKFATTSSANPEVDKIIHKVASVKTGYGTIWTHSRSSPQEKAAQSCCKLCTVRVFIGVMRECAEF